MIQNIQTRDLEELLDLQKKKGMITAKGEQPPAVWTKWKRGIYITDFHGRKFPELPSKWLLKQGH